MSFYPMYAIRPFSTVEEKWTSEAAGHGFYYLLCIMCVIHNGKILGIPKHIPQITANGNVSQLGGQQQREINKDDKWVFRNDWNFFVK